MAKLLLQEKAFVLLKALLIFAGGILIYGPVLHGGWMMDDDVYLTGNALLNEPERLWKAWFVPGSFIEYYPLEQTVQWMQWQLWHEETFGYHVTNLVLHLVSALLVWRLLSKFGLRLAWLGGLLFAIHPAMVESVVWIAEFKNTLSLPPFLLAMIFYLDYEKNGKPRDYFLALGFFVMAMLCKISMASFPFVILLYGWWKRGGIGWRDLRNSVPFFVVSLGLGVLSLYAAVWYSAASHTGPGIVPLGGIFSRVALTGLSIGFYFWNCIWPVGLLPIYPQWPVNPPSLLQFLPWPILGGILYGFWTQRKTWGRHALLGLGFFLILLGPFVTINVGGYTTFTWVMDHFLYIPILGVIGLAVAGLEQVTGKMTPALRLYGSGVLAVGLGLLTWDSSSYAGRFINQETLWTFELEHNPNAWLAHNNLGESLAERNQLPEAMDEFGKALQLNPLLVEAHTNWGAALVRAGRIPEAIAHYQDALQLNPHYAEAHFNWANALVREGQIPEAIAHYAEAVRLQPNEADAQNNWGNALLQINQPDEAMGHFQEALRLNPNFADAHNNWGNALLQEGQLDEAASHYREAVRLDPNHAEAYYNLGNIFLKTGQFDEAISEYQEAIRLKPDYAKAYYNWGNVLLRQGRYAEAIEQFQETLRLQPGYAEVHNNWGITLVELGRKSEAIEQFQETLRLKPDFAGARQNIAALQAAPTAPQKNK